MSILRVLVGLSLLMQLSTAHSLHRHHARRQYLHHALSNNPKATVIPSRVALSPSASASSTAAGPQTNNSSSQWTLVDDYRGSDFFNSSQWAFFTDTDPTHGQVNFVSNNAAQDAKLAYTNSAGNAILAVDASNDLPYGSARSSVRISSVTPLKFGQLLIVDLVKIPTGCSVWGAFWTLGDNWPSGGEIDIVEGVNLQSSNSMTLHTRDGCSLALPMAKGTGTVGSTSSCANQPGCTVSDHSPNSYGTGFNQNGGGVWAVLWNEIGINIWRFSRDSIPADIVADRPDPSYWSNPVANFDASACDPKTFFTDQTIVFDITLGGDWAGNTFNSDGCAGDIKDTIKVASNFQNAYFEIQKVQTYQHNS